MLWFMFEPYYDLCCDPCYACYDPYICYEYYDLRYYLYFDLRYDPCYLAFCILFMIHAQAIL